MIPTTSSPNTPPAGSLQPSATERKVKKKQVVSAPDDDDFDKWLDELAMGLPKMPSLPKDFSRADIYVDDEE